jgi:choline kinase
MGRKDTKDNSKKNDFEDMKRDQKLQAVLLADSFKKTFRPMTYESPKALMPLVNVPMIMYTIEFLAQNGVEEVSEYIYIHCTLLDALLDALLDCICNAIVILDPLLDTHNVIQCLIQLSQPVL